MVITDVNSRVVREDQITYVGRKIIRVSDGCDYDLDGVQRGDYRHRRLYTLDDYKLMYDAQEARTTLRRDYGIEVSRGGADERKILALLAFVHENF